jgi:chromate transporter
MMTILRLIVEFFKTGLFAVGGGLATLPFLYEMGEKTGWFTAQDVLNLLAVSESTPGPIGINMSTYVGFITSGVPGAVIASLSLAAPCVIVILLIAAFLKNFRENPLVKSAFYGLRPASTGLIASAGLSVLMVALFKNSPALRVDLLSLLSWNWKALALMAVLLYLTRVCKKTKKLHPIVFIGISAAAGVLFQFGA